MSYIRRDPLRAVTDDECEEKGAIEQAYTVGELVGLPVWCEDEAGAFPSDPAARRKLAEYGRERAAHYYPFPIPNFSPR